MTTQLATAERRVAGHGERACKVGRLQSDSSIDRALHHNSFRHHAIGHRQHERLDLVKPECSTQQDARQRHAQIHAP